ncbi:MAG: hypothetical protein R3E79_03770 [Caldilineaceae bacterium]
MQLLSAISPVVHLGKFFAPFVLSVDEQRKRGFLALFLITIIPVLLVFGLLNLFDKGLSIEVIFIFLGIGVGVINLLTLRFTKNIVPLFRLGVIAVMIVLTVELAIGGGRGVAFLWFYFHPVATFFLFGVGEGLVWVLVSWIIAFTFLVFNVGVYHYDIAISVRFLVTYTLVSILSYGLESSRTQYYNQLLAEKLALERALQQVKTLQGLLPICASCKKIRDDAGYWHGVETYISQHAEVQFSHSICPECRARLYPTPSMRTD